MKNFYKFISESNNLYHDIDVIEWRNNTVDLLDIDIVFIKKIEIFLKSIGFTIDFKVVPTIKGSVFIYTSADRYFLTLKGLFFTVHIAIKKDEWYYVKFAKAVNGIRILDADSSYYKCDQYDGLIRCLKDVLKTT